MTRIFRYWAPVAVYSAAIAWASLVPVPEGLPEFWEIDKAYHFAAYAAMGWLWVRAMSPKEGLKNPRAVIIAGVAAFLFGALMEVLQSFVPERNPDLIDAIVNGAGGVTGAFISNRVFAFMGQSRRRRI